MDDLLSKVEEILNDPQKLAGFKNLASSLINNNNNSSSNSSNSQSNNNLNVEAILKNFIAGQNNNSISIKDSEDLSSNNKNLNNKIPNVDNNLDLNMNMDLILKLKNAMEIMNQDDRNIIFLKSLKAILSESKHSRVDDAIKILRLVKLLSLVRDIDFLKNFNL